ncbi:MAG TPA: thiamine pyrophosphate-dependent enzyme, partial [Desulfomonilaceae bacterium]|nr:thiamine pyrophosphate-dependent enzyme [Desulfomonilaceae bacterium]
LLQKHQRSHLLARSWGTGTAALEALADALGAPPIGTDDQTSSRPLELPQGRLTKEKAAMVLAALQPENAIVIDESVTSGGAYYPLTAAAAPHSLLTLTGGSLGMGMPAALGAALARPDRPVISFQADGSAMYTVQALWSQAREGLNITTLICANRSYDILKLELMRAGNVQPGKNTLSLTDLGHPSLQWSGIAEGMGVPAVSVETAELLIAELRRALYEPGPHLIEMVLP